MEPLRQVFENVMLTQVPDTASQRTTSNMKHSFWGEGVSTTYSPPRKIKTGDKDKLTKVSKREREYKLTKNNSFGHNRKTSESWGPKSMMPEFREQQDKEAFSWDFHSGDEKTHPSKPDLFASIRGWKKSLSNTRSGTMYRRTQDKQSKLVTASPLRYEVYLTAAQKLT